MDKGEDENKVDYNAEPVVYCHHCLSLAIRSADGTDYCTKCGGTEMDSSSIFAWEKLYGQRYGGSYLTNNKNG